MASGSSSPTQPEDKDVHRYRRPRRLVREKFYEIADLQEIVKRHSKIEWSICRVPSRLREHNEDAYTPRIVSIGPIHSHHRNLGAMVNHKPRYMLSLFNRTTHPDRTLSECLEAIKSKLERARSYYDEFYFTHARPEQSLLQDACFILELFLRWTFWDINSTEIRDDPIFGAATIGCIRRDLALLENQIPFFVLEDLFKLIVEHWRHDQEPQQNQIPTLDKLCASFFYLELNPNKSSSDYRHLLDLIHSCYLPSRQLKPSTTKKTKSKQTWELIPCVTQLRESGIKFIKGKSKNLFDIKFFSHNGVLEIPKLHIDDTMDSLLKNMIMFEQCCPGTSHHITSYAILMDCLIDSPTDTEFLQQRGIIENYLGHGEVVSNIFNKISNKVFVDDFFFDALSEQVNEYRCRHISCWAKARASFVRDYCSSPWKFIGIVAATVLLVLTTLQTGYTMASYSPH